MARSTRVKRERKATRFFWNAVRNAESTPFKIREAMESAEDDTIRRLRQLIEDRTKGAKAELQRYLQRTGMRCGIRLRGPYRIQLVRSSKGNPDYGGVVGGLKGVQDQIASQLGIDDGDGAAASWFFDKMKGPWGVWITIEGTYP